MLRIIENVDSLNRLIDEQAVKVEELTRKRDEYVGKSNGYISAEQDEIANKARINAELQEEIQRQEELIQQRDKALEQQQKIADAAKGQGGAIGASVGAVSTQDADAELQALLDRFKTEEQLLTERYEKEREIAAENKELLLKLETEYQEKLKEIRDEARDADLEADQEAFEAMDELRQQSIKTEEDKAKANAVANKDKAKAEDAYVDVAMQASSLLFEDNKKAQEANAIINTAQAVTKALPNYPLAAAVAASGALQLATIASTSKDGGGNVTAPSDPGITEEPPSLEAQNTDLSNSNQTFTFKFDENGDLGEFGAFLNRAMKVADQNGLT